MPRQRLETSEPRDIAEYVDKGLDMLEKKLTEHIDKRFDELRESLLNAFKEAFPEGDLASHRLTHIKQIEADRDFKSLRRSLIEKGSIGLFLTMAAMNWEAIKMWLKEVFR